MPNELEIMRISTKGSLHAPCAERQLSAGLWLREDESGAVTVEAYSDDGSACIQTAARDLVRIARWCEGHDPSN